MKRFLFLVMVLCSVTLLAQDAPAADPVVPIGIMTILAWVVAAFGLLKAVSDFCNFIATQVGENSGFGGFAKGFAKVIGFIGGLIDYFTANSRAKK